MPCGKIVAMPPSVAWPPPVMPGQPAFLPGSQPAAATRAQACPARRQPLADQAIGPTQADLDPAEVGSSPRLSDSQIVAESAGGRAPAPLAARVPRGGPASPEALVPAG